MDLGLKDKIAMVAGASRGLGFAVAQALLGEGARVSISSRDSEAIAASARRLDASGSGRVMAERVDVRSADDIASWQEKTRERWGGVDLLVTNSGGPPAGFFEDLNDAAWQSGFELLVLSAIRAVRAVLPSMKSRPGASILLLTSSTVKEPVPNLVLSNVLRASVAALAKTLALELAGDNIRVNHLLPGRIATARLQELDEINARRAGVSFEEQRRRAQSAIPLGRYGDPEEFGRAAAFLLSPAASYITGATLQVDGGIIRSML